jgi:hypothetical protein
LRTATPNEINARNRAVIAEFRANGGRIDGRMAGTPLLLLHTVRALTARKRVNPLIYLDLGGGALAVFAAREGAPRGRPSPAFDEMQARTERTIPVVVLEPVESHPSRRD